MTRDYFESLQARLDEVLAGDGGSLEKYRACAAVLNEGIEAMQMELDLHGFSTKEEEIRFYKEEAPWVYGRLFFYMKLVQLEDWRGFLTRSKFEEFLRQELVTAETFLEKHSDVFKYYYSSAIYRDDYLFCRHGHGEWSFEEIGTYIDGNFTIGAYWLSHMRSNEQLRNWILAELEEGSARPGPRRIECTAKPVEAVEVFKALHLSGWFGEIPFKEVMEWVRDTMGVGIGKFDKILQEIGNRKISSTKCLDQVRENLRKWLEGKV